MNEDDLKDNSYLKMYICVLDEFPDYMAPTLVAHTVLGAHLEFSKQKYVSQLYEEWLTQSYKKSCSSC